jgi:hypothetical protein
VPPQLEAVLNRPVRFRTRIEPTRDVLEESLRAWLAAG